jgi:predicted TIM-barrel fold metal-dependent hydrolase
MFWEAGAFMSLVDTHIHVFVRGLPLAPVRRYVPEYDATCEDYLRHAQPSGVTHAVIVQPSFLGTDNSYMCGVLRQHRHALRGIAVVGRAGVRARTLLGRMRPFYNFLSQVSVHEF